MFGLIVLAILGIYGYLAYQVGRALYKRTQKRWLWILVTTLLVVVPFYDLIIGYFVFENFSREHPGVRHTTRHEVSGVLIEGRSLKRPRDGLRNTPFPFQYYEYRKAAAQDMTPAPAEGLREFVQIRLVSTADPTCLERLVPQNPGATASACVGVTSSDSPQSRYAYFSEPDEHSGKSTMILNDLPILPIYGQHSYLRDLRNDQLVAEVWNFVLPSRIFVPLDWYAGRNPGGGGDALLALKPIESTQDR